MLYRYAASCCRCSDAQPPSPDRNRWGKHSNSTSNFLHCSNRSAALLKLNKVAKALADADAAIERDPKWDKGHFRKAAALEAQDKFEEVNRCCAFVTTSRSILLAVSASLSNGLAVRKYGLDGHAANGACEVSLGPSQSRFH